jgi:hypothetical protein
VNKYQTLKDRLLQTFTLTESQRAASLLNLQGLGDEKPSQLMDKMLALLGGHTPCFLFREIFMRQMPPDIRPYLAHANIANFRELAKAADVLWMSRSADLNAVQVVRQRKNTPSVSTNGDAHISKPEEICYYHRRFGVAAKQCRPPCNFTKQGNGQAGRQ